MVDLSRTLKRLRENRVLIYHCRRHQSAIIPVRVGPHAEEFSVHRDILTKSEYFRKALDGEFREADDQAIDLPEEDPAIFSFVVAFLYEEKYVPIKPIATVLSGSCLRKLAGQLLTLALQLKNLTRGKVERWTI
jgi:hypothetical protein